MVNDLPLSQRIFLMMGLTILHFLSRRLYVVLFTQKPRSHVRILIYRTWPNLGCVFTTTIVSLNIPGRVLFTDFVKRLKNDRCFHELN